MVMVSYSENLTVKECHGPPYNSVKSSFGWDK